MKTLNIKIKKSSNPFAWSNREGNIGAEAIAVLGAYDPRDENSHLVFHINIADNPHLNVESNMVGGFINLEDADVI